MFPTESKHFERRYCFRSSSLSPARALPGVTFALLACTALLLSCDDDEPAQVIVAPEGVVLEPEVARQSAQPWGEDDTASLYDAPLRVFLDARTANSTIRYTLDGSSPGTNTLLYDPDSGIVVDKSCVLKAIATRSGWTESSVLKAEFHLRLQARPVREVSASRESWGSGDDLVYDGPITLGFETETRDGELRYTLDGSTPTRSSKLVVGGEIRIDTSATLKVAAFSSSSNAVQGGAILERRFILQSRTPSFDWMSRDSWEEGFWDSATTLRFVPNNPKDELRYTLDGSEPTRSSRLYAAPGISIDTTVTLKVAAFSKEGGKVSPSSPHVQRVVLQARPPVIAQSYDVAPFYFQISTPTAGASVRFTRDGSTPDGTDSIAAKKLLFGKYDDSVTVTAIAVPVNRRIQPSRIVRKRIGSRFPWPKGVQYGKMTDSRDGRSYRTLAINGKRWMAENLGYASGGSDYYRDTLASQTFGRVYSWSEAMDLTGSGRDTIWWGGALPRRGLCPAGWHVASDSEWLGLGEGALSNAFRANLINETYVGATYWSAKEYSSNGAVSVDLGVWQSQAWPEEPKQVPVSFATRYKSHNRGYVRCVED